MAEKQQFFCEKCGNAVAPDAERCPHCGRIFYAVRCPNCSFSGHAELFAAGCPLCGYHITGHEPPTAGRSGGRDRKWIFRLAGVILGGAIIYFFIMYFRM